MALGGMLGVTDRRYRLARKAEQAARDALSAQPAA
jgi:hypothetical protein